MSLPNTKSQKPNGFDDLTTSEKRRRDQINGQKNETNSSTPVPITIPTSSINPEKDEEFKAKKQKNVGGESNLQPKFTVSLSKREIEEDLYALTGKRHLRCKNRRDKKLKKKELHDLFPGGSLDNHDIKSLKKKYGAVSAKPQY